MMIYFVGFPRYPMDTSRWIAFTRSVAAHPLSVPLSDLSMCIILKASRPGADTHNAFVMADINVFNTASVSQAAAELVKGNRVE